MFTPKASVESVENLIHSIESILAMIEQLRKTDQAQTDCLIGLAERISKLEADRNGRP